jgi:signal transduction histidine kinase
MLDGVTVDELTGHFLRIATDRAGHLDLARSLRGYFHDARNRLNSLKIGLYLARRGAPAPQRRVWEELDQSYRGLEQLVDRLQTLCRPLELAPIEADLGPWLEERREPWTSQLAAAGRGLEWAPPPGPTVGRFDPMRLILGLDALVAWRASEDGGGDPARLAWAGDPTRLRLEWSERGPSVDGPLEGRDGRSPSMVLPLLAQLMTALGGSLAVANRGGLVVRLAWPAGEVASGAAPA